MEYIFLLIFYIVTLVYSIILHEISHGVMALWLGDKTAKYAGRLSLEPMRHIDLFGSIILPLVMILTAGFAFGWAKPVPYNPRNLRAYKWGEVLVALAGPITNYLLALLATIVAALISLPMTQKYDIVSHLLGRDWQALVQEVVGSPMAVLYVVCAMVIFWNVLLGTFNLIPIPPLDGSKLLYRFVPIKPQTRFFLEQWGTLIILILIMIPFFSIPFRYVLLTLWDFFFHISFA